MSWPSLRRRGLHWAGSTRASSEIRSYDRDKWVTTHMISPTDRCIFGQMGKRMTYILGVGLVIYNIYIYMYIYMYPHSQFIGISSIAVWCLLYIYLFVKLFSTIEYAMYKGKQYTNDGTSASMYSALYYAMQTAIRHCLNTNNIAINICECIWWVCKESGLYFFRIFFHSPCNCGHEQTVSTYCFNQLSNWNRFSRSNMLELN